VVVYKIIVIDVYTENVPYCNLKYIFLPHCFSRLADSILPGNRSQVQGSTFWVKGKKTFNTRGPCKNTHYSK